MAEFRKCKKNRTHAELRGLLSRFGLIASQTKKERESWRIGKKETFVMPNEHGGRALPTGYVSDVLGMIRREFPEVFEDDDDEQ